MRADVFNVCDDEPAPPQDVIVYAAQLLGMTPPPEEPFETAVLSPMARSFYNDSKRVSNARMKDRLAIVCSIRPIVKGFRPSWRSRSPRSDRQSGRDSRRYR